MLDSLFRQISEDEYACEVCGSVNTDDGGSTPSMMGGYDYYARCSNCQSVITYSPFDGTPTLRTSHPQLEGTIQFS